jgi:hypothetical protein
VKLPPWSPLRQRRYQRLGFFLGLGFCLALCTCVAIATTLQAAGCASHAADKLAPVASGYRDNTPAAGKQLEKQRAETQRLVLQGEQAIQQNTNARGFLAGALSNFTDFFGALPPASPRPQPIVEAELNVKSADQQLDAQLKILAQQRQTADGVIAAQAETIKLLAAQVGENKRLRDEAVANAQKMVDQQKAIAKWEAMDRDIFGRARHLWRAFKWFCILALPILLIIAYLGVRYGADQITRPVAGGIGAAIGWVVSIAKWAAYYIGTGILALIPGIGHWVDEHITHVNRLEKASKSAAPTTTPTPTPPKPPTPAAV